MPTIRQIAKLAGVAISTVSLALRDDPRVNSDTRAHICAIAARYHYRPNRPASSTFTGSTRTLGCLIPLLPDPFCADMMNGFLEVAYAADYQVYLLETRSQPERFRQMLHNLVEHRVDGVFLFPPVDLLARDIILELWSHRIHCVLLGTPSAIPLDSINIDETTLVRKLLEYLLPMGHQHLALCGPDPSNPYLALLTQDIARANLPAPKYIGYGMTAWSAWQQCQPKPTCIIAEGDLFAAELLRDAPLHGIHIPHDVSVVACNDSTIANFTAPPLTTMSNEPGTLGHQAAKLLLRRIDDGKDPSETNPEFIRVPTRLVVRQSCTRPLTPRASSAAQR